MALLCETLALLSFSWKGLSLDSFTTSALDVANHDYNALAIAKQYPGRPFGRYLHKSEVGTGMKGADSTKIEDGEG